MAAGGLLHLWNEWGIQMMVLGSFALQVSLLALGGIRRHRSSAVLSIALWLAYLSADSTAIYTLGHLSVASSSRSQEHQLLAFWAPFLLLHLGGPDNITAYSLEDNKLWLRHLQTLVVQVLGAAYVIYIYMISSSSSSTLLLVATISMFVAGLVKYGERTWALKCGNISSIAGSVDRSEAGIKSFETLRQGTSDDEEQILLRAHSHFDICKALFADITMPRDSSVNSSRADHNSVRAFLQRNLYKLVEMELSLMYDILYTKSAVIRTWYGFCIHFISLLGTATAFLLFLQLSIKSSSRGEGYKKYNRVDVVVSYVLLAGALVLETMSVCRALLSTWTCSFLELRGRGWRWLLHAITSLRRRVGPARRRQWVASIGQYNLLHLCSSDRNEIGSRVAGKVGLQDWWNNLRFSRKFSGTDSLLVEDLKMLVLETMKDVGTGMDSRGGAALERYRLRNRMPVVPTNWNVDTDLDKSITVWHIATHVYIRWKSHDERLDKRLVEATKVLSDYMMFLVVVKPDMLPGRTRHELYVNACKELDRCWTECLEKLDPSKESLPRMDNLAGWLAEFKFDPQGRKEETVLEHAGAVYRALKAYARPDSLEMIFEVWMEMMLYVAEHCSRDSHARELSHGCEFITIIWLMAHHLNYYSIPKNAISNKIHWW